MRGWEARNNGIIATYRMDSVDERNRSEQQKEGRNKAQNLDDEET